MREWGVAKGPEGRQGRAGFAVSYAEPGRDSTAVLRTEVTRVVRKHFTAWSLRSLASLPSLRSLELHLAAREKGRGGAIILART